jgi:hypothetical protein
MTILFSSAANCRADHLLRMSIRQTTFQAEFSSASQ